MTADQKQTLLALHAKLGAIREANAGRDETITRFCNDALDDAKRVLDDLETKD